MILSLVIVFVVFLVVVYFSAQSYINKNLSDFIGTKTNGLYEFKFDKIDLKNFEKSFVISGINLEYNQKVAKKLQAENPQKVFYTFSSPELQINQFELFDLLLKKNITINNVTIVSPHFKLTSPELFGKDSSQVFEYSMKEAKQIFRKRIKNIEIGEIEFINASYQFFNFIGDTSKVTNAEQVSVGISGFRTDSTLFQNIEQPFETEDIFVRIKGFNNEMSDSIHFLNIDSLEYSLKKAELKAFKSHLYSVVYTSEKSLYDVYIPEFQMRSRNLSGFNWSDSLNISFLEFENPEITFTQKETTKKLNIDDLNSFNLYELVKNDFSIISIDSFYLNDASLRIFRNKNDTSHQQKFNDIDIHLLKFVLDSASRVNSNKLLYADDIEMKVTDYELNLEDNLHQFTADSIYVSTFNDSLEISGIKINPLNHLTKKVPILLNIDCENIILDKVDLKKVYHERIIVGSVVDIVTPNVSISSYPDSPKRNSQPGMLFDLVSDYLRGVYSNLIHIEGGILNYKNYTSGQISDLYEAKFKFALTDFALDSTSLVRTDKFFYATDFDLNFSDFRMFLKDNLHRLDVKNIHISNTESKVLIDSLHLYSSVADAGEEELKVFDRSQLYDIFIPKITLFNANLHKAFFQNDLNISNFRIENPQISYENFATLKSEKNRLEFSELYDLIFEYVHNISITNLIVPSGNIKWINHSKKGKTITLDNHFSTELKKFRLNREETNKQKLLFSEEIKFTLNDPLFRLSDEVHYLKAGQIDFSTEDKNIVIHDALLYPDITTPE
ncbi:MAG: hypothetical protein HQ541_15070, partial [Mariniphaga sp.]|nr:hypothetical protein [Mariniphaga sp.]